MFLYLIVYLYLSPGVSPDFRRASGGSDWGSPERASNVWQVGDHDYYDHDHDDYDDDHDYDYDDHDYDYDDDHDDDHDDDS